MKQKNVWLAISVIFAVLVIIAGLYFATDLFKSPEQLFYKHLTETSKMLGMENYDEVMKQLQQQQQAVAEVEGEISAKITSNDEDVKEVADILGKGKIKYNVKTVGPEQKGQTDVTLNYNQKDIVTLNFRKEKEQYGIKVAEAYDKYVSIENNNLKALFQKLGVDASKVPNKIETIDYKELWNIDKETRNHIKDTYTKIVQETIPSECYTIEQDTSVSDSTTKIYKLTITQEQLKNTAIKLFETLKTDDITLELIINKYNIMMAPYAMMGMQTNEAQITKDDLKDEIEKSIQQLTKESASNVPALIITVHAAKSGESRIEISMLENNKEVVKFDVRTINKQENKEIRINCLIEDTEINMTMINTDKNISASIELKADETTIELNMTAELKTAQNVTVESFTKENSVKLNDMTTQEMNTLVQTIYTNVMKVLPQKMQLLGINMMGPNLPTI